MDSVVQYLQQFDLHPVVDHYTIAILTVGVLVDLLGSLAPNRQWIRYMALTLMIIGAVAAGGSYLTGGWEADRIYKALSPEAKQVLERHAEFAEAMAVVFAVLAVWRLLIEVAGFISGSRPFYLVVAIISAGMLLYVGSLGGELVYTYGAGTAVMPRGGASPTPIAPSLPSSLPTVTVPPLIAPTAPSVEPSSAPTLGSPLREPTPSGGTPIPLPSTSIPVPSAAASGAGV